jgi:hypothetical protein
MAIPSFLYFRPVPVRARGDGWSPVLQVRFVLNLARGMGPSEAVRDLGRSRQSAYALRRKPGGEGFAAAWDSAMEFAREARAAPRPLGSLEGGLETILVPRYYRGRLVGFVQREDIGNARRRLAALDRIAARIGEFDDPSVPDFETLLDLIDPGRRAEVDEVDANTPPRAPLRQFRGRPSTGPVRAATVPRND